MADLTARLLKISTALLLGVASLCLLGAVVLFAQGQFEAALALLTPSAVVFLVIRYRKRHEHDEAPSKRTDISPSVRAGRTFCNSCGAENPGKNFCQMCGAKQPSAGATDLVPQ